MVNNTNSNKITTQKVILVIFLILLVVGGLSILSIWALSSTPTNTTPNTTSKTPSLPSISPGQCLLRSHGAIITGIKLNKDYGVDGSIHSAEGTGWTHIPAWSCPNGICLNWVCPKGSCLNGDITASFTKKEGYVCEPLPFVP
jgi:hypothetical protein